MFEIFNLKDNAFPVTPSLEQKTPWFGFKALKQEFDSAFQRSAAEELRLCVLNRGRLGSGKTHAARYFSERYASRHNLGKYSRFIPIVIESPKQPQKAFVDFAGRLFNTVTFRRIAQASQNLRLLYGEQVLFSKLLDATSSEDVATVLSKIDESDLLTFKIFLLGGGTAKEQRQLGVAKRLTSEHEFALAIIGTLYLLINGQFGDHESISRVMLWVDEMEDLVYFPTRYYLPFTQAIREVIDSTNLHMTLMLNFTFSEPEDLPAIENVLGQAIMQRVNQHIVFQQPSVADLRDYLLELFKFNRVDAKKCSPTFPFSEDAFKLLIESAASRTPRFLNKLCDMLLRELEHDPGFDNGKRREISREIVEERLPRILNLLEEARG
jgi:hypothetical protein